MIILKLNAMLLVVVVNLCKNNVDHSHSLYYVESFSILMASVAFYPVKTMQGL